MKTRMNLAVSRQSAAILPEISHRRFPKRRYAGLTTFAFCFRALGQS